MAKKLKNVSVNSVDLCRQGANQRAYICLKKSMEGEKMSDLKTNILKNVCKELNLSMEDVCKALEIPMPEQEAKEQKMKKSMVESLNSILQDEGKTTEQKNEILQKSINEFFDMIYDFAKSKDKEEQESENVTATEDEKELYKTLKKKYEPENTLSPEVKKALQEAETAKRELEKLKKSLEIKELEMVAKKYEKIGKHAEELAPKLYELKKSNDKSYEDYIAVLDEMVTMSETSGLFKEYGTSRVGADSKKQQAEQRIQELMKSDSSLTYEQAFTRVCEESAELKKALEY